MSFSCILAKAKMIYTYVAIKNKLGVNSPLDWTVSKVQEYRNE